MLRWRPFALAIAALAVVGCAGPATRDDPSGVAVEADGARPIIDFPFDLAPMRQVPVTSTRAFVTRRGDGFLALWVESSPSGGSALKALALDGHGAPGANPPLVVGTTDGASRASIAGAACAPGGGDCLVLWGGPQGMLRVATIDAQERVKDREIGVAVHPASVAYDADVGQFFVALNAVVIYAFHVAKDKVIEHSQFDIGPANSSLDGVDCAPGHGCLVTFEPMTDPGTTSGVIVDASGAGVAFSIAPRRLQRLTYGAGVYFTVARTDQGYGVVRLGLDGASIDAAPLPILDLGGDARALDVAAFDGEAFTAIATAITVDDQGAKHALTAGGRILADGSVATPAAFELDGFGAPLALAGGDDGVCAAIVGHDAAAEAALGVLAIDHGAPAPDAVALAKVDAGQSLDAAFAVGGRVFAVWSEGTVARGRWFTARGGAASAVTELGAVSTIEGGAAVGDAGLLVVTHPDGSRATRVVTAEGVGPEVPLELPAKRRDVAASFGWLDHPEDGSVPLLRFDAEGRALDPTPIEVVHPLGIGGNPAARLARAGDLFVVATRTSLDLPSWSIVRVRDTGEIVGTTRFTAASLGGLACSTSACLATLRPAETIPTRTVLIGRLRTDAEDPPLAQSKIADGAPGPVAFDGRHFVAVYTAGRSLFVARFDGDVPQVGVRQRDGDDPLFFTATEPGRALLFSQVHTVTGTPSRPELVADASFVLVNGFGSAASGGSMSGDTPTVAEGGGCAVAPPGDASAAALLALTAVLLLRPRKRRRRGTGLLS